MSEQATDDLLWEVIEEAIEDIIKAWVRRGLDTAEATGLDVRTVSQIRGLHLAQPGLPATEIMRLVMK